MVPPLARGYTRKPGMPQHGARGSPARAGIHPTGALPRFRTAGFPRSRGDTPGQDRARTRCAAVPPLARGYTHGFNGLGLRHQGSPARAGIHPQPPGGHPRRPGFPRSRGDTPTGSSVVSPASAVPPLARGYTVSGEALVEGATGSPARAGIHLSLKTSWRPWRRFPRSRGDTPATVSRMEGMMEVPPLARGYTLFEVRLGVREPGSPARAGIHPSAAIRSSPRSGFPRSRGDTPRGCGVEQRFDGVPPLARGYTWGQGIEQLKRQGSPARAGIHPPRKIAEPSTIGSPARAGIHPPIRFSWSPAPRFPRSRGDTPSTERASPRLNAVPPLARGYTHVRFPLGSRGNGSPARAGIHPEFLPMARRCRGFPRSRGDTPPSANVELRREAVPPLARGYTRLGPVPRRRRRGFPRSRGGTLRLRSRRKVLTGPRREPTMPLRDDLNPQNGGRR